jgi:prolipoprotein diacylglyceryl transferase
MPHFKFSFENLKDWSKIFNFFKDHKDDEVIKKIVGRDNLSKLKGQRPSESFKKNIKIHLNKFIENDPEKKIPMLDKHLKGSSASVYEITKDLVNYVLTLSVILSLVGSRLFHVFFYDWPYYKNNLWEILMLHEGGLASHGGIIGIFIAWYIFSKRVAKMIPGLSFFSILDCIAISIGPALALIRIGNFFNQEIVGHQTDVPWAIIFGNPAGGLSVVARHPVQLYESLGYLSVSLLLYILWRKKGCFLKAGTFFALGNILYFLVRFIVEFFKVKQSQIISQNAQLLMGHYLSLPFIILGLVLVLYIYRRSTYPT